MSGIRKKEYDELEVVRLYHEEELSTRQVGAKIGLSSAMVSKICQKYGVNRKKDLSQMKGEIISLYSSGLSSRKVAEICKCNKTSVVDICQEAGVIRGFNEALALTGGENHYLWNGGSSYEPYCILFNEEFKERVREFWGRLCGQCGKTEEVNGRKLSVHHVNYDKQMCCNDSYPIFVPLCRKCHGITNMNRVYWYHYFTNYIQIWFDGICYLPKSSI